MISDRIVLIPKVQTALVPQLTLRAIFQATLLVTCPTFRQGQYDYDANIRRADQTHVLRKWQTISLPGVVRTRARARAV
jgi:hypothetical protein